MKLVEVLPFSVESPSSLHDDDFKHILDKVVELVILLYEGSDDFHIHNCWITQSNIRNVERLGRTDVFS